MQPSACTQLSDTVSSQKIRENTPEDQMTNSTLVEEANKVSSRKETPVLRSMLDEAPLRNTTTDSGLQSSGGVMDVLGSREKETVEEASFMKHIPCPQQLKKLALR